MKADKQRELLSIMDDEQRDFILFPEFNFPDGSRWYTPNEDNLKLITSSKEAENNLDIKRTYPLTPDECYTPKGQENGY